MDSTKFNDALWFNWQQPASPFLLGLTFDACGSPFRERFGFPCFTSILYYRWLDEARGYQASWLLRVEEGEACGRLLCDLLGVPAFRRRLDQEVDLVFGAMLGVAREARSSDLASLSDDDLLAQFDQVCARFLDFYSLGAVTEPIQWYVSKFVKDYFGSHDGPADLSSLFAMSEESYALGIEKHLLEIRELLVEINKGQPLPPAEDADAVNRLLGSNPELSALLDEHVERYYWKSNNYRATTEVTISAVLADVLSTDSDLVTTTVALREDVQKAELNRAAALDERAKLMASAPEFLRTAVRIGDEYGAALADRRKATMLPALDALDRFAKEFARRTSVPYELVAYLGPREVKDFFSNPTAYSDRLASREEGLVLTQAPFPLENMEMKARIELQGDSVFVPRQDEPTVAEGAAAVEVIKQLDVSMALLKSGEGDVNPRGDIIVKPPGGTKLRGIGRLVTDPRHDEFNRGEILIATSTTPDFMPAIRRAAALVVDMGGALSHAAIASRELGIPCVIGTSVATAIFGNGEEIEIDFESGEITRTGEKGAST